MAVLLAPVVRLKRAFSLSGVEARIASVWWRDDRLRRRRKRKPGEGERDEK